MTSHRKLRANKQNALRSTGPRTTQGKLRSRANARRHGLNATVGETENECLRIAQLTTRFAAGSNNFAVFDSARNLAVCQVRLERIRAARITVLRALLPPSHPESGASYLALQQLARLDEYERKARSLRKKALQELLHSGLTARHGSEVIGSLGLFGKSNPP